MCAFQLTFNRDIEALSSVNYQKFFDKSILELTLVGLKAGIKRVLGTQTSVELATTEQIKALLMKRMAAGEQPTYPYAYITLTEMDVLKDRGNNFAVQMAARSFRASHTAAGNTDIALYKFPSKIAFTLNVMESDAQRMVMLAQTIMLAADLDAFNFRMLYGDYYQNDVKVQRSGSITFPENLINTSDDTNPNSGLITCAFELYGDIGFIDKKLMTSVPRLGVLEEIYRNLPVPSGLPVSTTAGVKYYVINAISIYMFPTGVLEYVFSDGVKVWVFTDGTKFVIKTNGDMTLALGPSIHPPKLWAMPDGSTIKLTTDLRVIYTDVSGHQIFVLLEEESDLESAIKISYTLTET